MAKKATKGKTARRTPKPATAAEPRFPYTTVPNSFRRFLKSVPDKPRPPKVDRELLKAWDIRDTNAGTILRVLKAVNLIGSAGEPTAVYDSFMMPTTGPEALGNEVRKVYSPLFTASHEPFREPADQLKRLFHLHSGGGENTIQLQIHTFKVLCDFATFNSTGITPPLTSNPLVPVTPPLPPPPIAPPSIHIDLHIHLPENKSSRDYENIIQDIARYIYRFKEEQPNA
jgi:hypothetical protein